MITLWFIIGCISAVYMYFDMKNYYGKFEVIDYLILFFYICGGFMSLTVVLIDIYTKRWWNK